MRRVISAALMAVILASGLIFTSRTVHAAEECEERGSTGNCIECDILVAEILNQADADYESCTDGYLSCYDQWITAHLRAFLQGVVCQSWMEQG